MSKVKSPVVTRPRVADQGQKALPVVQEATVVPATTAGLNGDLQSFLRNQQAKGRLARNDSTALVAYDLTSNTYLASHNAQRQHQRDDHNDGQLPGNHGNSSNCAQETRQETFVTVPEQTSGGLITAVTAARGLPSMILTAMPSPAERTTSRASPRSCSDRITRTAISPRRFTSTATAAPPAGTLWRPSAR